MVKTVEFRIEVINEYDGYILGEVQQSNTNNISCYVIVDERDGMMYAQDNSLENLDDVWEHLTKN